MNNETHLFIIWQSAYDAKDRIIEDIQSKFTIKEVYEITWSDKYFSNNLSRFYGGKLPPGCPKEERIGHGPFTLVIIEDENPVYEVRLVSGRRNENVNTNMFDAKILYRGWVEGHEKVNDRVHATNTPEETSHDLTLLLGKNPIDLVNDLKRTNWDGIVKNISRDLVGAEEWQDLNQLFYTLNSTMNYVVLRNFDTLPDKYPLAHESDIDLLVEDFKEAQWIMNTTPVTDLSYRVLSCTVIAGDEVRFDLRHVGDNYYDKQWEENIIKNRISDPRGFYRPNEDDLFFTLLYHALIQKQKLRDDYKIKLTRMAEDLGIDSIDKSVLDKYMKKRRYKYTKPTDQSVIYKDPANEDDNIKQILRGLKRRVKSIWKKIK